MKKIRLTKSKYALVDDDMYGILVGYRWQYDGRYASRWHNHKKIYMHRQILATQTGYEVDHINSDKLDNRTINLRVVDRAHNTMNRRSQSNNTSGFRGVSWRNDSKKWRARASITGKEITIGLFANINDAINARQSYVEKYYDGCGVVVYD